MLWFEIQHDHQILDMKEEAGIMSIQDIYKIDKKSEILQSARYGQWDGWKGITILEPSIWKRRSSFHGQEFK